MQNNYWLSYTNVYHAVFTLLDDIVPDTFKISNIAGQTGCNSSMRISDIWEQLAKTYGKPNAAVIFENGGMLRRLYNPNEPPKTLFERVENCQEVAILGGTPYTLEQILNVATHLLKTSRHYSIEFCK